MYGKTPDSDTLYILLTLTTSLLRVKKKQSDIVVDNTRQEILCMIQS